MKDKIKKLLQELDGKARLVADLKYQIQGYENSPKSDLDKLAQLNVMFATAQQILAEGLLEINKVRADLIIDLQNQPIDYFETAKGIVRAQAKVYGVEINDGEARS